MSEDTARRPLIAGNWKMNTSLDSARSLVDGVASAAASHAAVDVIVFPPTAFLQSVATVAAGRIAVGAQNLHDQPKGAFTGEHAVSMLVDVGATYALCGHSERRHVFGESAEWVGDKVAAAQAGGLTPVLCVGETLAQREDGDTMKVVRAQLEAGCRHLDADRVGAIVIAYEPVWAIGTGRTASPAQAQQVHAAIRGWLTDRIGAAAAQRVRIQYGGSVKPANAAELLAQADIDGALVGGASLTVEAFSGILSAAASERAPSA